MRVVEITQRLADERRSTIEQFVERVAVDTGTQPLSDHLWLDLRSGGADGFFAVTVTDETGMIALAQISAANENSSLEIVVRPDVVDALAIRDDLVETALDAAGGGGGGGGGRIIWWVDDPTPHDHAFAAAQTFRPGRGLHEMRHTLPLGRHAEIETRAFVPGDDDDAWLAVNNRAFADHGEQGGWTSATLRQRQAEPWFDPDGFRIHEVDGQMAAFCWTKIHLDVDPVLGEIYVIAVDPDFHGRGLGRQLTLAGLDSIAARHVTNASLYVDADNTAAVGLYDSLGFHIHRTRQAFATDLRRAADRPTEEHR